MARSVHGLYPQLCDPSHLEAALRLTARGKRRRPDIAWMWFRREAVVADLVERLSSGAYRPRPFDLLWIRDPKPRLIARAAVEDRVVQTAVAKLLEPVLLRSLRPESYACRPGLGTHRATLRLLALQRRHRFVLHLDIRAYFPSIDLDILRVLLQERVRDQAFLGVMDTLLAAGAGLYAAPEVRQFIGLSPDWPLPGRGLPVGAYTSQILASHLYLSALDHHIKHTLKVPGYVRYVDDFFLFGDRAADMRRWRAAVVAWLHTERNLRVKNPHPPVRSCSLPLEALGYHLTRAGMTPRPRNLARLRRRAAAAVAKDTSTALFAAGLTGSIGTLMWG